MKKTQLIWIAIIIIVLVIGIGFYYISSQNNTGTQNTYVPTNQQTNTPTTYPQQNSTTTPPVVNTNPSPTPSSAAVSISNFSFVPATVSIKAGTKVTWTNNDTVAHTVTSDSGIFDSGTLAPGQSFSYTFSNTGTSTYHCAIHPMMKGTVVAQ